MMGFFFCHAMAGGLSTQGQSHPARRNPPPPPPVHLRPGLGIIPRPEFVSLHIETTDTKGPGLAGPVQHTHPPAVSVLLPGGFLFPRTPGPGISLYPSHPRGRSPTGVGAGPRLGSGVVLGLGWGWVRAYPACVSMRVCACACLSVCCACLCTCVCCLCGGVRETDIGEWLEMRDSGCPPDPVAECDSTFPPPPAPVPIATPAKCPCAFSAACLCGSATASALYPVPLPALHGYVTTGGGSLPPGQSPPPPTPSSVHSTCALSGAFSHSPPLLPSYLGLWPPPMPAPNPCFWGSQQ